ncbi:MAG: hypothetical protein HRU11_02515 [Parvularculaceae bacterium]|nr:hypothetical protein [Parvularculaceae bacterium]
MTGRLRYTVRGRGFAPWLVGCALARFAADGTIIAVTDLGPQDGQVLIKPKAMALHQALGVTAQRLLAAGAQRKDHWGEAFGVAIPFGASGAFGFTITQQAYVSLLKEVAAQASLQVTDVDGDLKFQVSEDKATVPTAIKLAGASSPAASADEFEHLAVTLAIKKIAFALPGMPITDVERQELQRVAMLAMPSIEQMHDLCHGNPSEQERTHRVQLWRAIGRVPPMDDDAFEQGEWRALLTARFGEPERAPWVATEVLA